MAASALEGLMRAVCKAESDYLEARAALERALAVEEEKP